MPGSQIPTILTATQQLLASVPGVRRVYTYQPVATEPGKIPLVMGQQNDIHYWTVRPESTSPRRNVGYQLFIDHTMVFRGYLSVNEPSITTPVVDALIRTIQESFDLLFSIDPTAEVTGPLQVTWPTLVMLADTFLCHYTEMRLPVQELIVVQ